MNVDYKDIGIRAAKTFVQAFLATLSVGVVGVTNLEDAKLLVVASVTAALAATFSLLQNWVMATK